MKTKILYALVGILWGLTSAFAAVNRHWWTCGIALLITLASFTVAALRPVRRHHFRDGSVVGDILRREDLR